MRLLFVFPFLLSMCEIIAMTKNGDDALYVCVLYICQSMHVFIYLKWLVGGWQVKSDFLAPASAMASVSSTDAWGLPVASASPAAVSPSSSQVSSFICFLFFSSYFVYSNFLFILMVIGVWFINNANN